MIVKPNDIMNMMNPEKAKKFIQAVAMAGLEELRQEAIKAGMKGDDKVGCVVTSDLNGWYYRIGNKNLELIFDIEYERPSYHLVTDQTIIDTITKHLKNAEEQERMGMPALFGQTTKKNDLPN